MTEALLLFDIPENIELMNSALDKPKITVDVEKMKRVFQNLIKNAFEAMPDGGKLKITSNESNGNVEIVFSDTGTGISKDVQEKVWAPFFTTKAKGMGLGLPICKRITDAHGGKISMESIVGKGTKFTVVMPVKPKLDGGEKTWVNMPESLSSTTTKA